MSIDRYLAAAPLVNAAAVTPGLNDDERRAVNGFAALTVEHNKLLNMDREDAYRAFSKLNPDIQSALKFYFKDDASYVEDEIPDSLLGKAGHYLREGFRDIGSKVWGGLTEYADVVGAPFRGAVLTGNPSEIFREIGRGLDPRTKMKYRGGEQLFVKEREAAVDAFYDPAVARIGKMLSMGKDMGEIMSEISTDEEWIALEQYSKGEGLVSQARRDYDNAKISYGREFGRLLFQINPGERGVEYKAYRYLSGHVDVAASILLDPTLVVGKFVRAARIARYSTMSLVRAAGKGGEAALINKVDDMFDSGLLGGPSKAAEFWDRAGALIEQTTKGTRGERAIAAAELRRYAPEFTNEAIEVFRQSKVFDANSARDFLKREENVQRIMMGRAGQESFVLPTHNATRQIKMTLRDTVRGIARRQPLDAKYVDDIVTTLSKGESLETVMELENIRGFNQRFSRMFERALRNRVIEVGPNKAQSAQDIYTLARTVLPRMEARVISEAFAQAPDNASARSIIRGLFDTIADASGVTRLGDQKQAYEEILEPIFNPVYSENIVKDSWIKSKRGWKDMDQVNPAMINGAQNAVAVYQLADQIRIADYAEIFKLATSQRAALAKGLGMFHHNRYLEHIVDYWSALNLLPRLGLRAMLDENLFHSLTMPVWAALNVFTGRAMISMYRRLGSAQRKQQGIKRVLRQDAEALGIPARIYNNVVNRMDVNEFRKLKTDAERIEFIETELLKTAFVGSFISDDTTRFISRFYSIHGPRLMESIGEGVSQSVSGSMYKASVASLPDDANLNSKVGDMLDDLRAEFGDEIVPITKTDPAFKVNSLAEFNNRIDRNGEIGRLSVMFMDNPDKAVREIASYFRGTGKYKDMDGPEVFRRFQLASNVTENDMAFRSFIHVRNLFISDTGEFNKKMLDKVRKPDGKGGFIIDGRLDPEDIDEAFDMLPSVIKGYQFRGNRQGDNRAGWFAKMIDSGFRLADRQLATLSRQPVYAAYYLGYSKRFKANEERFVEQLMNAPVKNGQKPMTLEQAQKLADERYGNLAANLALQRTLGYIDNPNVRTNFAMGIRNFARYYRAQEDFYRRVMRTVNLAENPTALVRFRMMNEIVDHSGWFQEDQNGDTYFIFPADEIMYNLLNEATGNKISKPMPLRLTGKIKMVTPSLDPESAIPTFSSPLSAIAVNLLTPFMAPEFADDFERAALGQYAQNRDLFYQVAPSVVRKALDASRAMFGEYATSEQVMSATAKGAATWTAMGRGLNAASTVGEREQFKREIWQHGRNIVFLRSLLGIFAPVSPQISQVADLDQNLLDAGVATIKTEYNELVQREIKKGTANPYDVALNKFARIYPGVAVYSVSETEMDTVAQVRQTRQVADFVKKNAALFEKYPQGAAFMVPNVGDFDIDAYNFLRAEGFMKRKDMDSFLEQIATIREENEYYDMRDAAEKDIANAPTEFLRVQRRRDWESKRSQFFDERPYLSARFENYDGRQAKLDALQDLEALVNSGDYTGSGVGEIRQIIEIYRETDAAISGLDYSDSGNYFRAKFKSEALDEMSRLAAGKPNAETLVEDLIRRLMGE